MDNPIKIVAVYFDYPHYMKPKEVIKVFELFKKRREYYKNEHEGSKQERMERVIRREEVTAELKLVLDVISAAEDRKCRVSMWTDSYGKEVAVLEIFEPVNTSLFDKPQEI